MHNCLSRLTLPVAIFPIEEEALSFEWLTLFSAFIMKISANSEKSLHGKQQTLFVILYGNFMNQIIMLTTFWMKLYSISSIFRSDEKIPDEGAKSLLFDVSSSDFLF